MLEVASQMASAMDCYEDMFKEITRKLYGEEEDVDFEAEGFKSVEHLTAAFGLATRSHLKSETPAVPPPKISPISENDRWISSNEQLPWTASRVAYYNGEQRLFKCCDCQCVGLLPRIVEHWIGTHADVKVFQCPQCTYTSAWARCVRIHLLRQHNIQESVETFLKENPILNEVTRYLERLMNKVDSDIKPSHTISEMHVEENSNVLTQQESPNATSAPTTPSATTKRYNCAHCPYATDRRDLFTRHENIHREDKPFQCYVCMKQFNRADHVKKHFLRMHREHTYDLNRIRKQPPKNASGMSFYHKYNESQSPAANVQQQNIQNHQQQINIPTGIVNPMAPRPNPTPVDPPKPVVKSSGNKSSQSSNKKKGDKKFSCCYCTWTGVDNWCLKRHLNTHLKPFVCMLCDYKAARSERLTTHILKVHNKRACTRCNFLADDQAALTIHIQENHPLDHRNNRNVHNRSSQNNANNSSNTLTPMNSSFGPLDTLKSCSKNEGHRPDKHNKRQTHGADRLFSYLEASDHDSSPEDETHPNKPQPQPPPQTLSRPAFPPEKIPNPHQNLAQFKPQDPKKMGDFSKMFFNNQFLGEGSKYMHDPALMKNMQVNYFSEQNLVFNKFLDEEKNLYYPNLPDSKNMFLNHPNFGAPTPSFFNPQYIQEKAKSAALMNHPSVSDVTKMYKHPDFFKAGNVTNQDEEDTELPLFICTTCGCEFMDDSSLENHQAVCQNNQVVSCRTFPAKKPICDDQKKISLSETNNENTDTSNIITNVYISKIANKKYLKTRTLYTCKICTKHICKKYRDYYKAKLHDLENGGAEITTESKGLRLSALDKYNNNNNKFEEKPKLKNNVLSSVSTLKQKYYDLLRIRKCIYCKTRHKTKSFIGKMSFVQHKWRCHTHMFKCEHCCVTFKHKYQTILHASREHV